MRSNEICSQYAPVTWQVDHKCHMISTSSFDRISYDMKMQRDDMFEDLRPHGLRQLVWDELAANNQHYPDRGRIYVLEKNLRALLLQIWIECLGVIIKHRRFTVLKAGVFFSHIAGSSRT